MASDHWLTLKPPILEHDGKTFADPADALPTRPQNISIYIVPIFRDNTAGLLKRGRTPDEDSGLLGAGSLRQWARARGACQPPLSPPANTSRNNLGKRTMQSSGKGRRKLAAFPPTRRNMMFSGEPVQLFESDTAIDEPYILLKQKFTTAIVWSASQLCVLSKSLRDHHWNYVSWYWTVPLIVIKTMG